MPLGYKHKIETKKKMSLAHIGRPHPMISHVYNPRNNGKKHSIETKIIMSKSRQKENHPRWKGGISSDKVIYQRQWKKKNAEKIKEYQRKHRLKSFYGISIESYKELLLRQNGVCGICSNGPECQKHPLSVDHDHITGRIRGILCSNCNSALGLMKENIENLKLAIKYLEEKNNGMANKFTTQ